MGMRASSLANNPLAVTRELDGRYDVVLEVRDNLDLITQVSGIDFAAILAELEAAQDFTGITGMGAGASTFLATPTSTNLAAMLTDETGTGAVVFANSPTLTGTPLATTAVVGTNTAQVATTAYVIAEINKVEEW